MALSIENWEKVLQFHLEHTVLEQTSTYFLSAEHDTIYFHCLTLDKFPPKSKEGKLLKALGLDADEDFSDCWFIHV